MKKLFSILFLVAFTLTVNAQSTSPRFGTTANKDNTGRALTYGYTSATYAATLTPAPDKFVNYYKVTLTGAATINITVTNAKLGDTWIYIASGSGGSRITTFWN